MIINKINIISFAGLKDKEINFEEKINLIYGENEKGKSTIQNFIRVWLYGMNSKRTKDLKNNDRVRFAPVDGDKIRGELYVTHNNRKYIIKRSFGATKKEDISEILDAESGEILTEIPKDEPGRYFLNVNSSTFYKTLFINQLGVAISKDKEEEIIDKAANLLNSDDTNIPIQKSIERLENIKKSISTVRKTGELDILRNRLNELNQEKYEGYKLSEENIHKENALISLREKRNNLRTEIKNLDIYKKYLKKSKLQKEYEEITQYLKKREELKKKERYIEESISSRNGIIDEVLLNDIKDENSLYFSLLDMKNEEEKSLSKSKEIYSVKREGYENLLFIEELSSEDKNAFIKAVMEKDNLTEKIKKYEELNKEINLIKNDISNKESYIGSAINFKGIRENIGVLLERYEDKLKELKFKAESYSSKSNIENEKLNDKFRKFLLVAFINIVVLILLLIFYRKNMLLVGFTGGILALILYKTITLKMQMSNEDKSSFNINSLEEDIRNIEKEIFKHTKLVEATSYEDFIKKLKLFDEYNIYLEKQNIKISEKESQIKFLNIETVKENYKNNEEFINKILILANTDDINKVIGMLSKYEEISKEVLSIKIDIEKEEKSIEKLDKELSIREKRIREKLEYIGLENIDLYELEEKLLEIKDKIKQRDEILKTLENIEGAYSALTKDKDIEAIKEDLKDIINENINYSYSSEEEIDNQVSLKSHELIEVEKEIKDVENYLKNRFLGKRTIPLIEEEIEEVKEKIEKIEKLLKATEIAIETMNESIREVRGNFGNILNSNVIDYFKTLTNKEYEEVMVSDSYDMKVKKGRDILPGAILSNGANDQLYLSLRLAFINMIYRGMDFPVILDDTFVQYDDIRTERALELLIDSNFSQTLIFTCQGREKEIFSRKNIDFTYINL
ncbi:MULTISPECIES: AAA family ATPase [unclassified Clostridium]|uniref:AAA family ATPase n=1 Tax=unclassified Clostridium TaxID=2614128 RepID=UPI0025BC3DB8|nr:AAA family ATPase [Clostridium sp.]MCI6692313.1 AAA family ATPase [Clostridium sp.]MDY4252317.1 AAA family ATPase [Clostridium sp.]